MSDYIEREETIVSVLETACNILEFYPSEQQAISDAIKKIPKANVHPVVRGRWRWVGQDQWNDCYECSQCGKMNTDNSNFCPNCGADMKGEIGGEE